MLKQLWRNIRFFLNYDLHLPYWLVYPVRTWQNRQHIKAFPPGTLVEICNYHPAIITETDGEGDITCFDLATQRDGYGCSLFHCGIVELTPAEVQTLLALYKEGGDRALMLNQGWTDEQIDQFKAQGY